MKTKKNTASHAVKPEQADGLISRRERKDGSAWKGTWDRPLKVDEESLDPLTVARMTDHNVRGVDNGRNEKKK